MKVSFQFRWQYPYFFSFHFFHMFYYFYSSNIVISLMNRVDNIIETIFIFIFNQQDLLCEKYIILSPFSKSSSQIEADIYLCTSMCSWNVKETLCVTLDSLLKWFNIEKPNKLLTNTNITGYLHRNCGYINETVSFQFRCLWRLTTVNTLHMH